jgi:polygalacturonase
VPRGRFLSNGPIHLETGVNLRLEEGAGIRFGADPDDYLPPVLVRWEGTRCYTHSPLLYARGQENIALTGRGTIEAGGGPLWRTWRSKQRPDRDRLRALGREGAPVESRRFGAGHFLRPDLFQAYDCRNVLVEGVSFGGSPFWTIHPVFCTNVTIRGVRVRAGATWNDDGIDPDSCRDVLIEDCAIEKRDDAIAIKSGRERDGWDGAACENVVVRGCDLARSGFAVGSEMAGGVRRVYLEDVRIGRCEAALQVKADTDQGGVVEDVLARRVTIGSCDACIAIRSDDRGVADHPYPPVIQRIDFEAVHCRTARKVGLYVSGVEGGPIRDVAFRDVTIDRAALAERVRFAARLVKRGVRIAGRPIE